MYGLNFLGGFTSFWVFGMGLHVSTHPARCSSVQSRLERWSSFEAPRWQGPRLSWFLTRYCGPPRVYLHRSENRMSLHQRRCQRAESGAHLRRRSLPCSSFSYERFAHRMLPSSRRFIQHLLRFSPGHNTGLLYFVCSLVKSGSNSSRIQMSVCSFVTTRRTCPCVSFCTPDHLTNISGYFQNSLWQLRFSFSRVKLHIGNPEGGGALALHIASGDVQNVFHHMGIAEWLRPFFFFA